MTVATWVCWSMISETKTAYGWRCSCRHGRSRPALANHSTRSLRRVAERSASVSFRSATGVLCGLLLGFMSDKALTLYTTALTPEQAGKLKLLLQGDDFQFEPRPYTLFFGKKGKLSISVYEKGPKVVIQG